MFKLHNNILIGATNPKYSEYSINGSDSIENLPKTIDSRYMNVSYIRNDYGHRTQHNPEDMDNFIMFVGCSICEGIGVPYEQTYAYIVAQHYKIPFYNMGMGAGSIDLIAFNISNYFKYFKKPKALIIQWPEYHRRLINNEKTIGPWANKDYYSEQELNNYQNQVMSDSFEHYGELLKTITKNTCKQFNIPIVEVSVKTIDYARDNKHPGIDSHNIMSSEIIKDLRPVL